MGMNAGAVEALLQERLEGAQIEVLDMTGTSDHFEVLVTWDGFQGKSLIEQHQLINQILKEPIADGRIHALKLKTLVPR